MAHDFIELSRRFAYHPPSSEEVATKHQQVRYAAELLAATYTDLCPESRELALALTKLEEAMFWANAAVARHQ